MAIKQQQPQTASGRTKCKSPSQICDRPNASKQKQHERGRGPTETNITVATLGIMPNGLTMPQTKRKQELKFTGRNVQKELKGDIMQSKSNVQDVRRLYLYTNAAKLSESS